MQRKLTKNTLLQERRETTAKDEESMVEDKELISKVITYRKCQQAKIENKSMK